MLRLLFRGFLLLAVATAAPALAQTGPVPFETLDEGEISSFRYSEDAFAGAELVINNDRAWREFWDQHTEGTSPQPPLPEVRFPQETVVVVLLGIQTSGGGPFIRVEEVWNTRQRGTRVRIVEDRTPGPLDVITNPYHIIKMPAPRGRGPVSFLHETAP
jgi:hypothetical protein